MPKNTYAEFGCISIEYKCRIDEKGIMEYEGQLRLDDLCLLGRQSRFKAQNPMVAQRNSTFSALPPSQQSFMVMEISEYEECRNAHLMEMNIELRKCLKESGFSDPAIDASILKEVV